MELVASSIAIASKLLVLGYDKVPQKSDLDDICFYNWFQTPVTVRSCILIQYFEQGILNLIWR